MRIAFIGLGRMGSSMARNLLRAGHQVAVYNRSHEKAEALSKDGAEVADSIAQACRSAEVCWTMLADDAAVGDAVFAPNALAASLEPHATHISSSTISVAMGRALSVAHMSRDQGFLSVPVFGRPDAAEAKKLIAVAGGDPALIERLRPLLESIGRAVFIAGPEPWQANLFKLCGNFSIASVLEIFGEAFATLQKSGADHRAFLEVMNELYGSPVYKNYGSTILERQYDPAAFALKLGLKDIRLMLEAAGEFDAPMPMASVLRDQFLTAMGNGQEQLDWSSLALVAERNAGVERTKL